eukprot:5935807-Prymnesium_polylepis.1
MAPPQWQARFVDFLLVLCQCNGKAVRPNQWRVCRLLLQQAPQLLFTLRVRSNGHGEPEVRPRRVPEPDARTAAAFRPVCCIAHAAVLPSPKFTMLPAAPSHGPRRVLRSGLCAFWGVAAGAHLGRPDVLPRVQGRAVARAVALARDYDRGERRLL